MKTKFLTQIPLFLLLVTLISCQSEEPNPNSFPEIGETSGNYIACRLNGEDYVSQGFSSLFATSSDKPFIGTLITNNGKSLYGKINYFQDSIRSSIIRIELQKAPIINLPIRFGAYQSNPSAETVRENYLQYGFQPRKSFVIDTIFGTGSISDQFVVAGNYLEFNTSHYESGEITFSKVDTVNQVYEGTFWADIKFEKYNPQLWSSFNIEVQDYWNLVAQRTNIDTSRVIRVRDGRFYFNAAKSDLRIDRR